MIYSYDNIKAYQNGLIFRNHDKDFALNVLDVKILPKYYQYKF